MVPGSSERIAMTDADHDANKQAKKVAKSEAKAAKKLAKAEAAAAPPQSPAPASGDQSATERSVRAAEQKVRLERWRTVIGAIGALIAFATFVVMFVKGC